MKYAIVGMGIAGMIVYLELLKYEIHPRDILVLDPELDGGDLARTYSSVQSNTPWSKTVKALQKYEHCGHSLMIRPFPLDKTTPVCEIAMVLLDSIRPYLKQSPVHRIRAERLRYVSARQVWMITTETQEFEVSKVILCQGATPKRMDCATPSLSLDVALDQTRLSRIVKPSHHVMVFGLAHSGTLILRNLKEIGCSVTAFYKTPEPFYFASDGHYDGIKEDSAVIAKEILHGFYPKTRLVPVTSTETLLQAFQGADWVISAIGFQPRTIPLFLDQEPISSISYSPKTAMIAPQLWGFGIAYPSSSEFEQKIYYDVSIASFQEHIEANIQSILH